MDDQPLVPDGRTERRSFLIALGLVTAAFVWLLRPFWGTLFWACALAVLCAPLYRRFQKATGWRSSPSAAVTLAVVAVAVIGPLCLFAASFFAQATSIYRDVQSGAIDLSQYSLRVRQSFPVVQAALTRLGLGGSSLSEGMTSAVLAAGRFVTQNAVSLGQGALGLFADSCLALYMAFFLIRDGGSLSEILIKALPLGDKRERRLFETFVGVIRSTVKGNVLMAFLHGVIGAVTLGFLGMNGLLLWGVAMGVLSLVPLVGTAVVWLPLSIYMASSGNWTGCFFLAGVEIAAMVGVDNVLRPAMVGRSLQMPDYLVLLSTLGGLASFGLGGMIAGPLVAALFMSAWKIFMGELNDR